jgi:hypothetical protein
MKTALVRTALCAAAFGALMWAGSSGVAGYSSVGHTWGTSQVYYYVNGQSSSLSASQVISGVQQAAAVWSQQSRANLQLVYGGTTSGSSLTMDYQNQVFLRNAAPGYAGETYWWYDGSGRLVDFDIALYEGNNRFYTGGAGCTGTGLYLEDLVVHEFGHGLGLGHSDASGATMAAWMPSYCDMTQMTLEPDDIAGIEALYPGGSSSPSSPPAESAPPPPSSAGVLNARGYRTKSGAAVDLSWSGFSSGRIDLYRNGSFLKSTPNDNFEKDTLRKVSGGTFTYYACNNGTTTCSSTVSVTF